MICAALPGGGGVPLPPDVQLLALAFGGAVPQLQGACHRRPPYPPLLEPEDGVVGICKALYTWNLRQAIYALLYGLTKN